MGMKPVIYSVKDADKNGIGWQRDGNNIAYYMNARKRKTGLNSANTATSSNSTTTEKGNPS